MTRLHSKNETQLISCLPKSSVVHCSNLRSDSIPSSPVRTDIHPGVAGGLFIFPSRADDSLKNEATRSNVSFNTGEKIIRTADAVKIKSRPTHDASPVILTELACCEHRMAITPLIPQNHFL